jgi:SAM-dependent methyltransferase
VRLNLGCGDDYREGYVNIDVRTDCGADEIADATLLPYADGVADEVLALDLLEHFPAARTAQVLAEWRRVLRPGGMLTVRVPNVEGLAGRLLRRPEQARLIVENLYGGHRWGPDGMWDAHHTGWTPRMLDEDLGAAGFDVLSNDLLANMTVKAVRR